jgi:ABC-type glycerol-3-phosphate transport system substrate-binding protein
MVSRPPALAIAAWLCACGSSERTTTPIRFLHTFSPAETELFNQTMADKDIEVESLLVPFARGQQVISERLRTGTSCPDLIRIDATWLDALASHLSPVPPELAHADWTAEAQALVARDGAWLAVPETVDGLVVVRDAKSPAPASPAVDDIAAAARAARSAAAGTLAYPLGLRADGYWLVPWLRADGGELALSGIDTTGASHALATFAALFGDLAAPLPPAGGEAPDELRRWNTGDVAYWVTGPWQIGYLDGRDRLAISALAHAPKGGQLLVVPTCAKHPADGWRLAAQLTSPAVEARFAEAFALVPTRTGALADAPPLVHAIDAALAAAEMLPHAPVTPLLFDDLNPALAAVIAKDATPDEAIAGVRRGWRRLSRGAP